MINKTIKAMIAGHICLNITPVFNPDNKGSFSEIFSPGKIINVGQAVLSTGGAVANTGQAMAKRFCIHNIKQTLLQRVDYWDKDKEITFLNKRLA